MHKLAINIIIGILCFPIVTSCAGQQRKTTAPTLPPWSQLPREEALRYESCDAATSDFHEIVGWKKPVGKTVAVRGYTNQYAELRVGPRGKQALLQFSLSERGKIYEMGVVKAVTPDGQERMRFFIDYFALRDIETGVITKGERNLNVLFSSATGEYFCSPSIN